MDAVRGLQRIERLRDSSANPDLPQQTIPQASKSVTNTPISKPSQTPPKPISPSPVNNTQTSGAGQFLTSTIATPSTPSKNPILPNWSRRKVITVGFAGAGLGFAIVVPRIWRSDLGETDLAGTTSTPAATREITRLPSNPNPFGVSSNSLKSFSFETVTVDAQGNITNRRKKEAKYFEEDLGNGVTLEMVQIPGGTFIMGSPEGEAQRINNESPQHQVKVPGFFMGKYEITQAQYQAIMGNNPSNFKGEKRPVEQVSWNDAVEFCKKLSQKTRKTYRLPSEAEWEYACRAGTKTPFYFGETITTDLVNYKGDYPYGSAPKGVYRQQTTDVGKFLPNSLGLYDMHGNVYEWCQDVYNDNYQGAPKDGSAWLTGKDNNIKLLRGGSWIYDARICRSAGRNKAARILSYVIGFRVVAVAVA
ncbi:MAG: formylglycine-generating enzyme family protein [Nostoc sp. NMS4]|nr:formylglycine-generating enzyme family protein [Nostoc sp. NMS4]